MAVPDTICHASLVSTYGSVQDWLTFVPHVPRVFLMQIIVSIKADLYELGAPDVSGFPALNTDEARLIIAAFGKDGPPVAAKRLTVKGRDFPVTVELTTDDLAFPLTKVSRKLFFRMAKKRYILRQTERCFRLIFSCSF